MDFRKVFDSIPEQFDKWRPRYCSEVFDDIIAYSGIGPGKNVLEIGPGTGQATEPILKTGCSYLAVELGENLAKYTADKFASYDNFKIINADFEKYELPKNNYDLVYSAATIQWIPEKTGFPKIYDILKSGGTLAMMMTHTDYKTPDENLYADIQKVYDKYFHPEIPYSCRLAYGNAVNYGFIDFECRNYKLTRELNADEFAAYTGTHCDHINLKEPYRTEFFEGIKNAVIKTGNKITLNDTVVLYLTQKP